MHAFDEMKAWVDFGADDEARLRALWPFIEPRLGEITQRFYARALSFPGAARVFQDDAQIERLRVTLRQWVRELLLGPWDLAYFARRERIGRVHVEVALEARYMFTAMHVVRHQLCEIAALEGAGGEATCGSISRICDLDLAIMTGTYVERREARQVQSLQELIVSHMPVTVLILDGQGRVAAATRPSARIFGNVEALEKPWFEALPAALVEAGELPAAMERALGTGREITLTRVDARIEGLERIFRVSFVPLDHPQARVLVHVEELTEAIGNEARLVRAESLAHLGAMSAAVAHELRNPLAGISGALQIIGRSMPADDHRKPIMEKVEAQVRRLNALVTDLLDFARPVAPKIATVDLADVGRAVCETVQRAHPLMRLAVSGSGTAQADTNFVHQVVLNLVLNAVQAVEERGEVRVVVSRGRMVVSDNGPGVTALDHEKIFQPFFTTKSRGTGLGLAICRKLLGSVGGSISLGDGPLSGAAFVIDLPA
jgi:signal transduction histidine kinase